ncbi:MAG: hypothetical protein ACJA08_003289 [Cyclobacteriaceae bacterium]|jgi:hypothetical protein
MKESLDWLTTQAATIVVSGRAPECSRPPNWK